MITLTPDTRSLAVPPPARRPLRRRWRINQTQIASAVLIAMVIACFILPQVLPLAPASGGSLSDARLPPLSPGHLLGTDPLGNDMLSRTLHGGRVSFIVGVGATLIGLVVGGILGMVAGYRGGWAEKILGWVFDVLLAFPALILALTIAAYLGPSLVNEIYAVSIFLIPATARIARASTLSARKEEFIVAARLAGVSESTIIRRHIIPNISSPLLTFAILQCGTAMIIEATLSFLGLGIRPPAPSWGNMMASGQQSLGDQPWVVLVPGLFLFVTIGALNLLGESLRQARDER
ncbi:ABC transporter permease subunit [Microbacterium sp. SYP-A9085]|jgi:peptide/nickel transport system permease protein|uniref:ABC transporter permease n=1 Tax=Microbacterium sp. SYP-A9085 TaxID=2664454 RepID=UPI00129A8AC4|nr:ABC transporter permease [Microbacterium sp. SYP-A9085]MRH29031.1 ABC transporter permease subunit [Microbacterium sp. SYP-A9085]